VHLAAAILFGGKATAQNACSQTRGFILSLCAAAPLLAPEPKLPATAGLSTDRGHRANRNHYSEVLLSERKAPSGRALLVPTHAKGQYREFSIRNAGGGGQSSEELISQRNSQLLFRLLQVIVKLD